MAYETLKDAIKQTIKQNGNQEITGEVMQTTLLNIIDTVTAEGFRFLGIVDNYGAPTPKNLAVSNAWVLAPKPGYYNNYGLHVNQYASMFITTNGGKSWFVMSLEIPYDLFSEKRTFSIAEAQVVENLDSLTFRFEHVRIFNNDFVPGLILPGTKGIVSERINPYSVVTPYIAINGITHFVLDYFSSFEVFGAYYDADMNYISDIEGTAFTNSSIEIIAPKNAVYVRLNTFMFSSSNLFVFSRRVVSGKKPAYTSKVLTTKNLQASFPFRRIDANLYAAAGVSGYLYAKYDVNQANFPKIITAVIPAYFKNTSVIIVELTDGTKQPHLIETIKAAYASMQVEIPEDAAYVYLLERIPEDVLDNIADDNDVRISYFAGMAGMIKAGDTLSAIFDTVSLGGKNLFNKAVPITKNAFRLQGLDIYKTAGVFYTDYIPVKPNTTYYLNQTSEYCIIWYDSNKQYISHGSCAKYCVPNSGIYLLSPSNAAYAVLNGLSGSKIQDTGISEVENHSDRIFARGLRPINENFYNKAVLWFGTSIPAGYPHQDNQRLYSYANRAVEMLGGVCINKCVPNGVIRKANHDGTELTSGRANLSFTNTNSSINYINSMLSYVDSIDYFVFDYGVNDFDADRWDEDNSDFSSLDVNTFVGAYNFVLKQLFDVKPDARVILLTHYTDDNIQKTGSAMHNDWKKMNDVIKGIGAYWHIKVICLNELTGWHANAISNNLSYYIPDSIHPASAVTDKGLEQLSHIIYSELLAFK